jgi:CDP-6-deoxy-D-xylo-4-hexulose-3-dehydrase
MVNSGSSADLLLCYLLTDPTYPLLSPGDEILLPIVTWPTQIWSAMMAGMKVKVVDVDPNTLNIDLESLEAAITPKTKAIFLVHLMGNPCKMDEILALARKHNLYVIEDCCEALGSEYGGNKVGNFGVGGAYSFFFSHHMMTMEGGMIVCNDPGVAERLRILRAHGWVRNTEAARHQLEKYDVDPRYAFINWGFNVRPTDVQAGFGLAQLEKLPEFNRQRKRLADQFFGAFANHPFLAFPEVDPKANPSWLALPMMLKDDAPFTKGDFTQYLESEGIETRPIVAGNIARHPVAEVFPELKQGSFPGADLVHKRGLYIGLSPMFSEQMVERLIETIRSFLTAHGG